MREPWHKACDVADSTAYPFQGEVPRRGDFITIQRSGEAVDEGGAIRAKVIQVEWVILIEGTSRATIHYERIE